MTLSIAEHHDPPSAPPDPMAPLWAEAVQSTYLHLGRAQAHAQMLRLQAFFETDSQFSHEVARQLCTIVEEAFLACEDVVTLHVLNREHYAA